MGCHVPALLLFARQQTRGEADAQDLVQEALVECWGGRPDSAPPAAARVYATIRRRAADWGRSQDRRTRREAAACEGVEDGWFDGGVEERERNRMLQEAIGELPGDCREVLTLKTWGGLTFAEIAQALGIPANTAASRYRYGLEHLRQVLRRQNRLEMLKG